MDVKLPNGTIVQNVPDGITQTQLLSMLDKNGVEHGVTPQPQAPAAPPPNTYADVVKSAASGLGKGVAAVVGLPGDVRGLLDAGANKVRQYFDPSAKPISTAKAPLAAPTSTDVNNAIQSVTEQYHAPQTTAGKYAETIASFAPAAIAPGGIATRAARVIVPATASEAAGEFTQGTELEPYARVAGAVAGGLIAGPAVRSINALTTRLGAPIQNPNIAASELIRDAVKKDGGVQAINANLRAYRGISNPALIDVSGNNVRRLVRSAASGGSGEAQNVATTYADRIAGNLQDNSLELTRRLTPVTNSAENYQQLLEGLQRDDANFNYKGPYSEPASVTPQMVSALQGPEGRGAINRAYAAARANRDVQQMGELKDLQEVVSEQGATPDPLTGRRRTLQQALEEVSAGTLDRVRIAMRETGGNLAAKGARDIARGYKTRVADIDTALDQTPGLKNARASYADYARQQDALEHGQTGMHAPPDTYAATLSELAKASPRASLAAGVGYRQALVDAIQRPAEGATGTLNRIATSTAQTRNLGATFGPSVTQDYQTGIQNEIDRLRNARFISPNTGSQTELRTQDAALVHIPISKAGLVGSIFDKIKSATSLTEQERTALVKMGTTEAQLRQLAARNPSLTSRALTTALLGNQSGQSK